MAIKPFANVGDRVSVEAESTESGINVKRETNRLTTPRKTGGGEVRWTFTAEGENLTRVTDHIEYEHHPGLRGVLSRLLFPRPGLFLTFTYRKLITRWSVR